MSEKLFEKYAATEGNEKYEELIKRHDGLYSRHDDVRSPFARDYTRILHSTAYRRLKHKTQVFYNVENDHICTRMEHVSHVESVSGTIAKYLGLNDELTRAISTAHDLGHAPFGHQGEKILTEISEEYLGQPFWHEKNGLRFVDKVELLEDNYKVSRNLNLTYAVRDGIISHCGEVDENGLKPRNELIDLDNFSFPGQYMPATWEGCVVKIADKIAYVGRDIEDAIALGFITTKDKDKLVKLAKINDEKVLNTTVIMHNMVIDICKTSCPEKGISLSEPFLHQLNEIKEFNYEYIYAHPRFLPYMHYTELVLHELFNCLLQGFDKENTLRKVYELRDIYGSVYEIFLEYLVKYCDVDFVNESGFGYMIGNRDNYKIYGNLDDEKTYITAIIDYISGMTDSFAIRSFQRLLTYS